MDKKLNPKLIRGFINILMCKKSFVGMEKGKRKYKLYSEDIKEVFKFIKKKRPSIPKFECLTEDNLIVEDHPINS